MQKIQVDLCNREQTVPEKKNLPRGGRAFSRDFIINLSPQCRAFSRAFKTEKLKSLLFQMTGALWVYGYLLECHNHETQPSWGTKGRRDEEQIRTTQTPLMKPQTHKLRKKKGELQRWTSLERSVGKLLSGLDRFYSRETSPLSRDAAPNNTIQTDRKTDSPVSILYKSIVGRYRPVRVADGPITARYRFIKNASWEWGRQPLKKMTTTLASQHENSKQTGQPYRGWPQC